MRCPRWWCGATMMKGECVWSCGWKPGDALDDLAALRRCRGAGASPLTFQAPPTGRLVRRIDYRTVLGKVLGYAADPSSWQPQVIHDCPSCHCADKAPPLELGWWRIESFCVKEPNGAPTIEVEPPWAIELVPEGR